MLLDAWSRNFQNTGKKVQKLEEAPTLFPLPWRPEADKPIWENI